MLAIEACGLGQRDWDIAMLDALPQSPLIPGIEAVGRVVAKTDVQGLAVGQLVGVTPVAATCGQCAACTQDDWPTRCEQLQLHGFHRQGALTQRGRFKAQHLVPLSVGLEPAVVAPILGSGWAALSAVRRAHIVSGQRVGVWGLGGVGHLAARYVEAAGADVVAHDLEPSRRGLARAPRSGGAQLDAALVCTPSQQALQQAIRAVRRGGTVVLCGSSPMTRLDVPTFDLVGREVTLAGSFLGPKSVLMEALAMAQRGEVTPLIHRCRFEDAPPNLYTLRDGGFSGRLVVTMPNEH